MTPKCFPGAAKVPLSLKSQEFGPWRIERSVKSDHLLRAADQKGEDRMTKALGPRREEG